MRLGVVVIFGALWIASSSEMSSNSGQVSLQINCPEATGCFGLIGKALASAPTGSTIHIGPGVFYEQPLVIERSLTLQGAGADLTKIRPVEPGSAITIRSIEPIDVLISSLTIVAPFVWDKRISAGVVWIQESNVDKTQTVVIKDSEITSFTGVLINASKGSLTIQRSRLWGISSGIDIRTRGEIAVAVEDTLLDGPFLYDDPIGLSRLVIISSAISFMPDDSPGRAYISLKNNQMQLWHLGLKAISIGYEGWSRAEVLLVNNMIAYNKVGVHLGGDSNAEFRENTISNNDNGVTLFLPPCASINSYDILAFRGQVRGKDNVIIDNKKGDLCPPDYPWPPGFRK